MVLLTMTPGIVRAVSSISDSLPDDLTTLQRINEPSLMDPKLGNPISHVQIIDLSKLLKHHNIQDQDDSLPTTLSALLLNAKVYIPPPPPKKEPTPEYLALMARLRAEEEALSYERMLHPPPTRETFNQRFPAAALPYSLGSRAPVSEEDELTYDEVHRQIILIINVLVSIIAVGIFIWVAARHWSVGKRLGLSMGGSGAIAIAEVAVYSGYVRKVREAKRAEKKKPEIKEIVKSWVIDKDGKAKEQEKEKDAEGMRYRKGKHR